MKNILITFIFLVMGIIPAIALEKPNNSKAVDEKMEKIRTMEDKTIQMKLGRSYIAELDGMIQKDAKNPELFYKKGNVYFYIEDDANAIKFFSEAISLSPAVSVYHFKKGISLYYLRDIDGSIKELKTSAELDKKCEECFYELGCRYSEKDDFANAEAAFKSALRINPEFPDAMSKLGGLYAEKRMYEKALPFFREIVKRRPENVSDLYNLGVVLQQLRNNKEAADCFSAVVKKNKEDWQAIAKLLQISQSADRDEEVNKYMKMLFALYRAGKVGKDSFCREQIWAGDVQIVVMQAFELKGEFAKPYVFLLTDSKTGRTLYELSLESFEADTQIARETGQIKKDERVYTYDYHDTSDGDFHGTLGIVNKKPEYKKLRKIMLGFVDSKNKGTLKFVSSTVTK
ncbi:MAG: hypothetical protein CVV21_02465 [Candidatus Goldiibacteriota bacterium HGW-Goldbacteria-1]|jgi:tetratricopeptide (TPR) repeat protein|nr:MAG: hypothetical protein CVV21_02465 [Candidatus Goldiibacteriota bacterium HGW-Goldbacteria-1]